jgi:hypothetical protein
MTLTPSDDWLSRVNSEMSAANVEHRQRAWRAWDLWLQESRQSLGFDHPTVKRIFDWFDERVKPGSQNLGPLFSGAFFYDAEFWPLKIPVFFGSVRINAFDSLIGMPVSTVRHLGQDESGRALLASTFEDSVDVGTGYDGCRGAAHHSDFCLRLLAGGYQMLTGVPPLLLNGRPNAASLQSGRFAVEIYLKAFLAARDRLTESSAKNEYGHRLDDLVERCITVDGDAGFDRIKPELAVYPPVQSRYEGLDRPPVDIWRGYSVALSTAAIVNRVLIGTSLVARLHDHGSAKGQ